MATYDNYFTLSTVIDALKSFVLEEVFVIKRSIQDIKENKYKNKNLYFPKEIPKKKLKVTQK